MSELQNGVEARACSGMDQVEQAIDGPAEHASHTARIPGDARGHDGDKDNEHSLLARSRAAQPNYRKSLFRR